MKSSGLVLFLFLFSFTSYAQRGVNYFKENDGFWNRMELNLTEDIRSNLLKDFQYQDINSFHFLHLNADSIPDLIYQDENRVEVYLYYQGQYKQIGNDKGKITGVQQNVPFNITTCYFYQTDCCENEMGYYQQWVILPNDSGVSLNKLDKIYFNKNIEIPDFLTINLKFKVNDHSVLYNSPSETNKQFAEYSLNSQGYAFSSKIDSNKQIWWFVIMDPIEIKNRASGIMAEKRMGWMKSQNLRVVNH